tara:strand:+ start:1510 stop:2682 length:1173 start_codon:yes stop_codon:yes gene_type:complete
MKVSSQTFQPLVGKTVIDLTQVLAGPYATYQLALLGAEVLKIENPNGGDWTREGNAPDGLENQNMGTAYLTQNANKKSIGLDLKSPRDIEKLKKLVENADVFVENFRPGTAARLGLSYTNIKKIKPNIVYCSISGFGQDGPISNRPAYDHIVQGMCGIMRLTGTNETEPNKVGAPYVDYATGLNGAFAIVSALHEVNRTGKSVKLDVAMLDTSLLLMSSLVTDHLNNGWIPEPSGNEAWSRSPSSGAFETQSDLLMIAANNERQFERFCTAINRKDLLRDKKFQHPTDRKKNKDELRHLVEQIIKTKTAEYWEEKLNEEGVPATKVRKLDEILSEHQVEKRGITHKLKIPGLRNSLHVPTLGFKVDGEIIAPKEAPPRLGQDTDYIIEEK